jgi:protein-S-isoprenylcysteine O-methyltransferase Ste14
VALGVPLAGGLLLSAAVGEPVPWPEQRVGAAVLLLLAFAVWNGWSLVLFHRHATGLLPGQPTTELLVRGPFAVSRNPLYIGLVALYVGIALAVPSFWALLLLPAGVVALRKGSIEPEEAYLLERFGPAYEEYCSRVPRWL